MEVFLFFLNSQPHVHALGSGDARRRVSVRGSLEAVEDAAVVAGAGAPGAGEPVGRCPGGFVRVAFVYATELEQWNRRQEMGV